MNINVVLVTYNRKQCLEILLNALKNQTKKISNVFIFDNNSNDGTLSMLHLNGYVNSDTVTDCTWNKYDRSYFNIHYFKSKVNSGGSGGFNQVITEALKYECDYVWIMDDDVEPENNCLEILCSNLDREHQASIPNRTDNYFEDNVWVDFDLKRCFAPGLTSTRKKKICHPLTQKLYEVKDFPFEGPLISYQIMKQIGPSDSKYFIICDDTDYALNVQKFTKIFFCSEAVLHRQLAKYDKAKQNQKESINWKQYYSIRNYIAIMKKYGENFGAKYFNIMFNFIYWNIRALKTMSIKNVKYVNKAIIDGTFDKMGKTVEPGSF